MKKITTLGKRILAKKVTDKPESKLIYSSDKFKWVVENNVYRDDEGFLQEISILPGTEIIVKPYTGQQVTVNGEEFTIFNFDDIVAMIEGDDG